jgi:acetyl esterase/lipase
MLVTAGEHEVLIDQIQAAAAAIAVDDISDTTTFDLPGGGHEDFIEAFGSGEGGRGTTLATASTMERVGQYGDQCCVRRR